MDISWEDVRLFLAVAEAGSVSGAARRLRWGQPTVTRRLALLEHALGEKLFRRSVAGAALTTAGERLLDPARRMAEWAGEVGRAAASTDRAVTGLVRFTAPPFTAFDFLAPFAAFLGERHPGLRLEVLSSMQHLDLPRGEADLALRVQPPPRETAGGKRGQRPGSELALLETFHFENAVFVSRALRARLPRGPLRLDALPWIAWAAPWEELPPNPQLRAQLPGFVPAFTSDHFLVNLAAAEAGLGAMVLPRVKHRFQRASTLVPLKVDLGEFQRGALHLVCAKSALDVPRVRLVADLVRAELRRAAAAGAAVATKAAAPPVTARQKRARPPR